MEIGKLRGGGPGEFSYTTIASGMETPFKKIIAPSSQLLF